MRPEVFQTLGKSSHEELEEWDYIENQKQFSVTELVSKTMKYGHVKIKIMIPWNASDREEG